MHRILLLLSLMALTGCLVTDDSAPGGLSIKRDDVLKTVIVNFEQPTDSSDPSTVVVTISPDGEITTDANFGSQFNVKGIANAFKAMRVWHYTGIALVLSGFALAVFRRSVPALALVSRKAPAGMIVGGILCAVIGHAIPTYGGVISIIAGITAMGLIGYVLWQRKP